MHTYALIDLDQCTCIRAAMNVPQSFYYLTESHDMLLLCMQIWSNLLAITCLFGVNIILYDPIHIIMMSTTAGATKTMFTPSRVMITQLL